MDSTRFSKLAGLTANLFNTNKVFKVLHGDRLATLDVPKMPKGGWGAADEGMWYAGEGMWYARELPGASATGGSGSGMWRPFLFVLVFVPETQLPIPVARLARSTTGQWRGT